MDRAPCRNAGACILPQGFVQPEKHLKLPVRCYSEPTEGISLKLHTYKYLFPVKFKPGFYTLRMFYRFFKNKLFTTKSV